VFIHGGPTAQAMNAFSKTIQYLVNQGFFVITPNYRGSTGYGKEFEDANRFDMGGGDLDDVISAAEWIKKTGFIDPKKVAVAGGSYGGYLTMMAVTKAPDMWAAGVPIVPFVNWFTEVENEDPLLREYDLATMGDPMKDKVRYQERSPINFVDQIRAPLLLLAGGNDPRCPHTEAEQVASAVKKRGGVAELKVYENEGHGFAKIENQIDAYTRVANFLKKYAEPAKCGCNIYGAGHHRFHPVKADELSLRVAIPYFLYALGIGRSSGVSRRACGRCRNGSCRRPCRTSCRLSRLDTRLVDFMAARCRSAFFRAKQDADHRTDNT
jgi:acetyl esterase/lipase